jgi:hypothetical protein
MKGRGVSSGVVVMVPVVSGCRATESSVFERA